MKFFFQKVITQGTETVNALTEALKRDEQRFSLPREEKRGSLTKQENNIAGSYFKTKYGTQNGDQVKLIFIVHTISHLINDFCKLEIWKRIIGRFKQER